MNEIVSLKATHGLHSASKRQPDKTAVIFGARSVTYGELTSRMKRVSYAGFIDIRFQGNAAIVAQNSVEYLEVLLGLADVGVPVATINPKSTEREVLLALNDCSASVLFIDKKLYKESYSKVCKLVITFGEEYEEWISKHQEIKQYPFVPDSTTFAIVYSSGTTGAPKGIKHSHRSRTMISLTMAVDYDGMKSDDIMLALASLSNGGGCSTALACLTNGGTLVLGTQVHPDYMMRMIEQHRVTCAFIVPTLLHIIVNTQSCYQYDRSSLRCVFSSAAPFSANLKRKAIEFFGNIVYDVYASTECGPVSVLKPKNFQRAIHSVGQPVSGSTIEIRKEDGTIAGVGDVGEIYAKTLTLFNGYLTNSNSTNVNLKHVDNEFVSAGDLGYIGWDGYLYIVGRKSDMIITGGNNVYPEELESVINSCPGVIESAVVGMLHDRWGEVVVAFVVGTPTVDLFEYCRDNLASYKLPRKVNYVDSIPKSETGKILRRQLRELL
ncbi:acyl--CoA ligase [bacterium]|nr:acyl--CoA ligase [bacterium]